MKDKTIKYSVPSAEKESEVLANKLGLKTIEELERAEVEGFFRAEDILLNSLQIDTIFDFEYIKGIHRLALEELYDFAGRLRTVNISKDGFYFPPAKFLQATVQSFENDFLKHLPENYKSQEDLISDIASVHAELLFIHPFREGNGRTARILANMMSYKGGYFKLKFEKLETDLWEKYIKAIHKAADNDYTIMKEVIECLF